MLCCESVDFSVHSEQIFCGIFTQYFKVQVNKSGIQLESILSITDTVVFSIDFVSEYSQWSVNVSLTAALEEDDWLNFQPLHLLCA